MAELPVLDDVRIGVIGLGYVGLPIAIYMAQHFPVVGFDVDASRTGELSRGIDRTNEITAEEFASARDLKISHDPDDLAGCNFYIVTVPTPIDNAKRPDFSALLSASRTIGGVIAEGDVVVYESTVFPDATEEVCIPVVEQVSGLAYNRDFYAGYSPERINPGDKNHRLPDIRKIVSGSTPEAADLIDAVYSKVITAGTHRASSIRVAEAAKVIENIQRDVNIALINELAMLFRKIGLDTGDVLEAAGTKWNFHKYKPGLVGGHCIGIDPFYLTYKAQSVGFHPDMILAGRRINDNMAEFVANDVIAGMLRRRLRVGRSHILIMGLTFKENCPDLRNTKVADLAAHFLRLGIDTTVYDPMADPDEAKREYGIELASELPAGPFEAVILAVNHDHIRDNDLERISGLLVEDGLVYDIKGALPRGGDHIRL